MLRITYAVYDSISVGVSRVSCSASVRSQTVKRHDLTRLDLSYNHFHEGLAIISTKDVCYLTLSFNGLRRWRRSALQLEGVGE